MKRQIFVDGSSQPNPGDMGIGIVIVGQVDLGLPFGEGTNQVAELLALREGLRLAEDGDKIFSDSQYAIKVVTGEWKPKDHLKLIHECRELLYPGYDPRKGIKALDNPRCTLTWIHGHSGHLFQERADRLANHAARYQIAHEWHRHQGKRTAA